MQKEETTGDHQEFDEMYRRTQAEIYKFIRYKKKEKIAYNPQYTNAFPATMRMAAAQVWPKGA